MQNTISSLYIYVMAVEPLYIRYVWRCILYVSANTNWYEQQQQQHHHWSGSRCWSAIGNNGVGGGHCGGGDIHTE